MITESRTEETIYLEVSPVAVAQACRDVLNRLGSIKSVSRELGIITGRFSINMATNPVYININIRKKGNGTELGIKTQRKEGLLTSGGAQSGIALFTQQLQRHKNIKGKSSAGW